MGGLSKMSIQCYGMTYRELTKQLITTERWRFMGSLISLPPAASLDIFFTMCKLISTKIYRNLLYQNK